MLPSFPITLGTLFAFILTIVFSWGMGGFKGKKEKRKLLTLGMNLIIS